MLGGEVAGGVAAPAVDSFDSRPCFNRRRADDETTMVR